MHIRFETIRFKNFISVGNDFIKYNLNDAKTTLITGKNGFGKSLLLDAICFVLFNKPFRKINKPQLINTINGKNLLVEIEFYIGKDFYKVIRGIKPTIFDIYKNGEKLNQDAATKDYQVILEKYILKLNYKTFTQVVILGSAAFTPFMQLTAAARREIIEELLDLQIFTTMNLLLKDKINDNNRSILDIEYQYDLTNEKIKLNEDHIKSLVKNSEELIFEHNTRIKSYKEDIKQEEDIIEEKRNELSRYIEETKDHDRLIKRLSEIDKLKNQLNSKKERYEDEIKFFSEHDNCPVCNQIIDLHFKQNSIELRQNTINETNNAIENILEKYLEADTKLKELKKVLNKISDLNADIKIKTNKIKTFQNSISDLENQIKKLNEKNRQVIDDNQTLKTLEDQLLRIGEAKKDALELRDIYKVSSIILKDNGIKAKIIKQYIPIINKLINKYLASMDFLVQFELDENFNETIKSRFRDEFSYSSFSEGEKAKIDLALLFTWRTIAKLRNSASTNILILDEVFNGSLDGNAAEDLIKILIELSNDSNIIVISHTSEILMSKFDKTIIVDKVNNFTRIFEE